jgi:hypothetical protein
MGPARGADLAWVRRNKVFLCPGILGHPGASARDSLLVPSEVIGKRNGRSRLCRKIRQTFPGIPSIPSYKLQEMMGRYRYLEHILID